MPKITLDLSNYRETTSGRVPEGTYKLQVEDVELTKSKAGNDMIVLYLRIAEGDFKGTTLIERLTLSERALFRVVGFMQAINLPTPRKRLSLDTNRFVGKYVMAEVSDSEPYNGRVNSQVNTWMKVAKQEEDAADDLADDLEEDTDTEATEKPAAETDTDDLDIDEIEL